MKYFAEHSSAETFTQIYLDFYSERRYTIYIININIHICIETLALKRNFSITVLFRAKAFSSGIYIFFRKILFRFAQYNILFFKTIFI